MLHSLYLTLPSASKKPRSASIRCYYTHFVRGGFHMQQSLGRYISLARRWVWLVLSGILICGSVTFIVTLFIPPTYTASSTIIINLKSSSSPYENLNASE